ncbi:unnamed protein product [Parnassius apollo]|uniref:(apollo) hypothetical protein n=1 Tax=Parnassius apollo TaxID=110799 RepID=A0A8S3XS40_PARAO|nr:unnamed protein product [Parnassius apollo]
MEPIKKSVADLTEHFNLRMVEFQKDLKSAIPATSPNSNINHQFNTFRSFVLTAPENFQLQVELLSRQKDNMEMRHRKKILLVHGVKENKKENTSACAVKVLSDYLKIPGILSESISRSHRLAQAGTDRPLLSL